jgi:hypothetical protein
LKLQNLSSFAVVRRHKLGGGENGHSLDTLRGSKYFFLTVCAMLSTSGREREREREIERERGEREERETVRSTNRDAIRDFLERAGKEEEQQQQGGQISWCDMPV